MFFYFDAKKSSLTLCCKHPSNSNTSYFCFILICILCVSRAGHRILCQRSNVHAKISFSAKFLQFK